MDKSTHLLSEAHRVLEANFKGEWTQPAPDRYPHQWLWDSCFIAIGQRHNNPHRAAAELVSTLRGQWDNGMIAHMVYAPTRRGRTDARFWNLKTRSKSGLPTSPITQPPMLAIAAELVAKKLPKTEKSAFLDTMLPALIDYHAWMYRERSSDDTGLITLVHPWECGLDNTPPWMDTMRGLKKSFNIWGFLALIPTFGSSKERVTFPDAARMVALAQILHECGYDNSRILKSSPVLIQDLAFNAILVQANEALVRMAKSVAVELPGDLISHIAKTKQGIEILWDKNAEEYRSRDARTGQLIPDSTVATFLPISALHKGQLINALDDNSRFAAHYPIPSISRSHPLFTNERYWQGPSWVNMNWLVIRSLEAMGESERAGKLKQQTLEMAEYGMYEYYDPDSGVGHGAKDFSWTAALVIDLISE